MKELFDSANGQPSFKEYMTKGFAVDDDRLKQFFIGELSGIFG